MKQQKGGTHAIHSSFRLKGCDLCNEFSLEKNYLFVENRIAAPDLNERFKWITYIKNLLFKISPAYALDYFCTFRKTNSGALYEFEMLVFRE